MRHHNNIRKFGRENNQRRALLRSLAESLLVHGKIKTTESKAKELRPYIEKLITLGRKGSIVHRNRVSSRLGHAARASALMKIATVKYKERPGGYTRIIKIPARLIDGSRMAIIELI